jgi:amino acid transporter
MTLKKNIKTGTLLGSAVAGIVGSGWLLGPMVCAKMAGPAASITWIIAGLLMMIVAASFVLLTRATPVTGGTVRFFQLYYGHFAGFSFAWVAWLAWVAVPPIETMALIQYSTNYLPSLMTHGVSPVLTARGVEVAVALMIVITMINGFGVHVYGKINTVIVLFKLCIPVATAAILLSSHPHFNNFNVGGSFMPNGIKSLFSALPLAGVIYSFIGFNPVIQLAAESKTPGKSIPIAIFGALGICMVLYTLVQVAFIVALPPGALQHGWSAIEFANDHGPFVGLLAGIGFIWFVKALYVDAVISPFGTGMVQSMATSRLTYAMGQNGYFSRRFLILNKHHAPSRALWLNFLVGILFFLPFPSWQHMVGFLVSCLVLGYVVGPMSLMVVTATQVERFNGIPRWFLHLVAFSAFYICNLMIFWTGWQVIWKLMLLFIIGFIVLAIKIAFDKSNKLKANLQIARGSWIIVYLIGMAGLSYLSSFGGLRILSFGIDFAWVAVLSMAIYSLAYYLTPRS